MCPTIIKELTTADTAGTNVAQGESWAKQSRACKFKSIAYIGGNAVMDSELDIFYGTVKIANKFNTKAEQTDGSGIWDKDHNFFIASQKYCPAGTRINVEVVTAPTDETYLSLDIQEL